MIIEYDLVHQLMEELLEAWNSHDVQHIVSFYASDFEGTDVAQPGSQCGREAVEQSIIRYLHAFPDVRLVHEEVIVQECRVVVRWKAESTHLGSWINIPPTGRAVSVQGTSFLTMKYGKIIRGTYIWDVAGLLRCIGLLPDL